MKKVMIIGLLVVITLVAAACSDSITEDGADKLIPVEVRRVYEEERIPRSSFLGTVQPGKTVRLSFKTGGRIEKIAVEKGDTIKKGDVIAVLEKTDLMYAVNLARTQVEALQAQYEKAVNGATDEDIEQARLNKTKAADAYQYALDRFDEVEKLYLNGTASKQVYDQAKLEVNIRESDLKLAEEVEEQVLKGARQEDLKALSAQIETAETEYNYRKAQLEEATLRSTIDGTVVEVLSEKGEITGSGYPVAVLRTEEKVIYVGVPEKDLKNITAETKVAVEKDGKEAQARILRIAEMPDSVTGLYNIELAADNPDIPFGAVVTVHFLEPAEKGIYIPIQAILNDGKDYVYTVSDGKAVRKNITIAGVDNFEARITGLNEGDLLVTSGTGRISDGEAVTVKGEK